MRLRRSALLLTCAALLAAACSGGNQPADARLPVTAGTATAGGSCASAPPIGPLPTWARSGFHPPDMPMPHVLGDRGHIVAILWLRKNALHAPPLPDQANKILWVSRVSLAPPSSLKIRATLVGTHRTVYREVTDGPGPSYVNLPSAGCWALDLTWSGHTDHLDLRYVAG